MIKAILGRKIEMRSAFDNKGREIPLTLIEAGPCPVIQVKREDKDGYLAIQLGFGQKKQVKKPLLGHLKKAEIKTLPRYIRETRVTTENDLPKLGEIVRVSDVLSSGDLVSISGTSKGKGFTGVMKRWGFSGGPKTHGQSDRQRAPGSIGQGTTPGRVFRGKKMAGRKGGEKTTVRNLEVIEVDSEKNLLKVRGQVPGVKGGLLFILRTGENKKAKASGPEGLEALKEESKTSETERDEKGIEKEEVKAEVQEEQQKENPPPLATEDKKENANEESN